MVGNIAVMRLCRVFGPVIFVFIQDTMDTPGFIKYH